MPPFCWVLLAWWSVHASHSFCSRCVTGWHGDWRVRQIPIVEGAARVGLCVCSLRTGCCRHGGRGLQPFLLLKVQSAWSLARALLSYCSNCDKRRVSPAEIYLVIHIDILVIGVCITFLLLKLRQAKGQSCCVMHMAGQSCDETHCQLVCALHSGPRGP